MLRDILVDKYEELYNKKVKISHYIKFRAMKKGNIKSKGGFFMSKRNTTFS